jgi:hypothetical protein
VNERKAAFTRQRQQAPREQRGGQQRDRPDGERSAAKALSTEPRLFF